MPIGRDCEFASFEACIEAMAGKVDDPHAFCGALQHDTEER